MSQPTMQEARSRQTAMEAERHFWTTRLHKLAAEWHRWSQQSNARTCPADEAVADCAEALRKLITERTR